MKLFVVVLSCDLTEINLVKILKQETNFLPVAGFFH